MATQKLYAGVKLRETRAKLGLTQKLFAERLGVSLPYLNQMENNHRPRLGAGGFGAGGGVRAGCHRTLGRGCRAVGLRYA